MSESVTPVFCGAVEICIAGNPLMLAPEKRGATEGIEAGAEFNKGVAAQLHVIRTPDRLAPSPRAGSLSIPGTTTVSKVSFPTELLPLA